MIKREHIIKELVNKGYAVEPHTCIKNGVKFEGICFKEENGISPVIYTDEIIGGGTESLSEAVEKVLDIYNNNNINFNKEILHDVDFIMKNLYIGLQKTSAENLVKEETDFEGIEKYLYVRISEISENASFKLTYRFLEMLKLNESELWEKAKDNTFAETKIVSMAELLSELAGHEIVETEGIPMMYVVTNTMKLRGASAVLDKASLKKLAQKLNTNKFIVMPSSIHEMIIIPCDENSNIEEFSMLVHTVNLTQVLPEERLTNQAYMLDIFNE